MSTSSHFASVEAKLYRIQGAIDHSHTHLLSLLDGQRAILDAIGKLATAGDDPAAIAAITADVKAMTQTLQDAMGRDNRPDSPTTGE